MKKIAIIGDSCSPHVSSRIKKFIDTDSKKYFFVEKNYNTYLNQNPNFFFNFLFHLPKIKILTIFIINYFKLKKINPDYIFLMHCDIYNTFLIRFFNSKKVLSLWGNDILIEQADKKWLLARKLFRYSPILKTALQNAHKIFCVSHQISERVLSIQENKGVLPEILYYGIDLEMYDTPKPLDNKIDVFENLKDDTILIYSPRWCKNEYNIHIIVKVFVNLRLKFDNIHLCIQSSSLSGTDKDYLNEIMNLISEHNLQSHITIVGLSDFSERLNILNRSNIIVSIPFSDGTPVSVLEAMYLKKIVLCHQIPSTESIIRDNFNGFLVDAKFEDIFTSKLSFIIQNYHTENCFFHIADNAKKFVIDNADLNKEILAYNDSFN